MTRADLRSLMSSWLDDIAQAYFTPTQQNVWLNLAQRKVQLMLIDAGENWYETPVETLTVTNQSDYVLPVDFIQMHRLEVVVSGTGINEVRQQVESMTTNEQDRIGLSTGVPTNFYIKKRRIVLFPTPDRQYTIRMIYSPIVADMTQDSDSPDVPEQFMEYVAILATYDGFIKDDRAPENLLVKKKDYEAQLNTSSNQRTVDKPRSVVMTGDSGFGDYF